MADLHVLSLGAGVQSTTLLLMYLAGEIEGHLDCAIFADVGWEPAAVYKQLEWLEGLAAAKGLPVYRVSRGNIRQDLVDAATGVISRVANPPYYVKNENEDNPDKGGMLWRSCTAEYKIRPIDRKIRELLGVEKGRRVPKGKTVEQWMGISIDEWMRAKDNRKSYIKNRFPLIELGMSRKDCLYWLKTHGYHEPPKSACIGCPYHSNAMWRDMKMNHPEDFADAVDFDHLVRPGLPGTTGKVYVHRSMVPLDEVDLRNAEDLGQLSLFNQECEGMCGV
jgi:hypothetical protein